MNGLYVPITYWVIQNDCGQVWQLCTKIYVATVWVMYVATVWVG
jgi:hypothetical protein